MQFRQSGLHDDEHRKYEGDEIAVVSKSVVTISKASRKRKQICLHCNFGKNYGEVSGGRKNIQRPTEIMVKMVMLSTK